MYIKGGAKMENLHLPTYLFLSALKKNAKNSFFLMKNLLFFFYQNPARIRTFDLEDFTTDLNHLAIGVVPSK